MLSFKRLRDMPKENQPEYNVLVIRGLKVLPKFIGGQEEFGFKAKISAIAVLCFFRTICFSGSHREQQLLCSKC